MSARFQWTIVAGLYTIVMAAKLNYDANIYLAVTLSSSSPYLDEPSQLALVHPAIAHVGQAGSMEDVQLLSVSKKEWSQVSEDVIEILSKADGVARVDVQKLQARTKKDEL